MAANGSDATLARAVIDLGNTLGMMTMADRIERAEQFTALLAIGCVAVRNADPRSKSLSTVASYVM